MAENRILKVDKVFQDKIGELVFSLLTPKEWKLSGLPSRLYLGIRAQGPEYNLDFLTEKPEQQGTKTLGFAQIARKYLAGLSVALDRLSHSDTRPESWCLGFSYAGQQRFLLAASKRPALLNLIDLDKKISLARMSADALYTKSSTLPAEDPLLRSDEFSGFADTLFRREVSMEALSPASPRSELAAALKRRIRTLRKSLHKAERGLPSEEHEGALDKRLDEVRASLAEGLESRGLGKELSKLFEEKKKSKRAQVLGKQQLNKMRAEIARLENLGKQAWADTPANRKTLGLKAKQEKRREGESQDGKADKKGRRFLIDGQRLAKVARQAKEGDELVKAAKSSEHWLHTAVGSGSHVLVQSLKADSEWLEGKALRQGAILALHYSDQRQSKGGEVWLSRRAHLRKTKGLPPGKWLMARRVSVMVVYDDAELLEVLEGKQE